MFLTGSSIRRHIRRPFLRHSHSFYCSGVYISLSGSSWLPSASRSMPKKALGIIGFGEFSRLMIEHLSPFFDISVASRHEIIDKQSLDFKSVDTKTALAQPFI